LKDIHAQLSGSFITSLSSACPPTYRVKRATNIKAIAAEIVLSSITVFDAPPPFVSSNKPFDLPIISSQPGYSSPPPIPSSQPNPTSLSSIPPTTAYSNPILKYATVKSAPKKHTVTERILSHWMPGTHPDTYDYLSQARADQEATAMESMSVEEREKIRKREERRIQAQIRESQRFTQMSQRVGEIEETTQTTRLGLGLGGLPTVPESQGLLSQALLGSQAKRDKDGQPPKKKKRTKGF
jgi:hypothetical protein